MHEKILDSLPQIYQRLLPDLFRSDVPTETKATCSTCPMTKDCTSAAAKVPQVGFHPTTKCCSYQPGHVNYLVGALLSDTDPALAEGQARMLRRIEGRLGQPFGVSAPTELKELYESSPMPSTDLNPKLVCGFYDSNSGGTCTIWKHREAVCSTFFCKHVRAADGRSFWMSVKEYLELVEDQLSRYATYRVAPELFFAADARLKDDGDIANDDCDSIWRNFAGKEVEFYKRTFAIVDSLKQDDIEKLLGFDGMLELDQVKALHNRLKHTTLPDRLRLSPAIKSFSMAANQVGITGYNESDAFVMTAGDFAKLKSSKNLAVDFGQDLLEALFRHRILIAQT